MSFINWGEDPDKSRETRRKFEEEQAIYENAIRIMRSKSTMSGASSILNLGNGYVDTKYSDDGYVE